MRASSVLETESGVTLKSLESIPQWIVWAKDSKGIKKPKDPTNPSRNMQDTYSRPDQWRPVSRLPAGMAQGIILGQLQDGSGRHLCGIDLDSCFDDGPLGDLLPWAQSVVERFQTYGEVSPSKTGMKLFFLMDAEGEDEARAAVLTEDQKGGRSWGGGNHTEIGLTLSHRFYAVTRQRYAETQATLRVVPASDVIWLAEHAAATKAAWLKGRSDSPSLCDRSAAAMTFAIKWCADNPGKTWEDMTAAMLAEGGAVSEWATEKQKKKKSELRRTFANASKRIDSEVTADSFDDLPFDPLGENLPSNVVRFPFDPLGNDTPEPAPKTLAQVRTEIVQEFNQKYAVLSKGRKAVIMVFGDDESSYDEWEVGAFHLITKPEHLFVKVDGKAKLLQKSEEWLKDKRRTFYRDSVFEPNSPVRPDVYNRWRGWPVSPGGDSAKCEKFLWHIRHIICGGNESYAHWLIGWMAQIIQHPETKMGTAIVLRGIHGCGKDTFAELFGLLMGGNDSILMETASNQKHFLGGFNKILETAILFRVAEGFWAGNKQAESNLKDLVVAPKLQIEQKGVDSDGKLNYTRFVITSNEKWVVPAAPTERRWAVFDVKPDKAGQRKEYFEPMYRDMENGGAEALMSYLMEYDYSDIDLSVAPKTEAFREQVGESLSKLERWWFDSLTAGHIVQSLCADWSEGPLTISRDAVWNAWLEWGRDVRWGGTVSREFLGKELRRFTDDAMNTSRPRIGLTRERAYVFPSLHECREAFNRALGTNLSFGE